MDDATTVAAAGSGPRENLAKQNRPIEKPGAKKGSTRRNQAASRYDDGGG
jgi:hypothetical protein